MEFAHALVFAPGSGPPSGVYRRRESAGSTFTQPSHMQLQTQWVRAIVPDMQEVMSLMAGWDSHGAAAPDRRVLWWALVLLDATECVDVIKPQVVPTIEGGVQFEWYLAPRELEVAFCPAGHMEYLKTDLATGTSTEEVVDGCDALDVLRELIVWVCGG